MSLDNDLKQVLARRRPPAGFSARVMARIDRESSARTQGSAPRWIPWAVAAALLLSSSGGVGLYRQHQQRVRAEQARDQLLLALHVTGAQLDHVRAKVRSISETE
jgi:hypothetical protein